MKWLKRLFAQDRESKLMELASLAALLLVLCLIIANMIGQDTRENFQLVVPQMAPPTLRAP